jgi:DNA-binding response OmpR family regulator
VEDNQDISGYICEMLKIAGYQPVVARNLMEGLLLAKDEHFDLYLLDYDLPDGTGIELCKLIRALDSDTPILFYSSTTKPEIQQEAFAAGAQGYIGKMEAFDILEQTITKLLESGRLKNTVASSNEGEVSTRMFSQQDFDRFVERYNADYHYLLLRASMGQYDCLLTSFLVLKDLYTAIINLHEVGNFKFRIIPYPISLRASEVLLGGLGFNETEVKRIDNFFKFVKETQGKEFEDIIKEGALIICPMRSETNQPQFESDRGQL